MLQDGLIKMKNNGNHSLGTVECKGQLISKCPYEKSVFIQNTNVKISEISALASKKRSNQKNKGTLLY